MAMIFRLLLPLAELGCCRRSSESPEIMQAAFGFGFDGFDVLDTGHRRRGDRHWFDGVGVESWNPALPMEERHMLDTRHSRQRHDPIARTSCPRTANNAELSEEAWKWL